MATISEHDRRQLARMAERLGMMEDGRLSLQVLVADLEILLSALESVELREKLREKWGVLEEVYSVAIAGHGPGLDKHAEQLVRDTVKALRTRVGELVGAKMS